MLTPLTERQKTMIVNNVEKVLRSGSCELLTKQSYDYLYLCSGFIAHYNLYGFRDYYSDTEKLAKDILDNATSNQWYNFHEGENDYEYYMAKKDVYNRIAKVAYDIQFPLFARA